MSEEVAETFSETQDQPEEYTSAFAGGDFGDEPAPPEASAPIEDGQAEVVGDTTDEPVEDLHTVTVNGETVQVPLSEALAGYQRQSDYTRKTQELSRAQALQAALENNPQATLRLLQETYGAEQDARERQQSEPAHSDFESDEPVPQYVRQLEQQVSQLSQYQTRQVLDGECDRLAQKYGEHWNEGDVLQEAVRRGERNPLALENIFRDLSFDKFYAKSTAEQRAAKTSQDDDRTRQAALLAASGSVSAGNGSNGVAAPVTPTINSVEDAYAAALAAHGLD